jgi:polyhydroxyalkanoate synthesis regulator protein
VSTHAETIQYANLAIQKLDELINFYTGGDALREEIEGYLRAAFTDTDLEMVGQMHQMVADSSQNAIHHALLLKESLQSTLEKLHSAGA